MGKNDKKTYGVNVTLTDAEANAITEAQPAGMSTSEKLGITSNSLLRDLAKGGVMIGPEYASRIEAAINSTDQVQIVEQVERGAGKQGEATVVNWVVDPTQIAFYQQLADSNGVSLQHELKSMLDHAFEQGWFGMAAPDVFKILLEPADYRYLQEQFGKDVVTGADVMELVREQSARKTPRFGEEESDPVLDSLRG